jgi:hypothetical protein
MTVHIRSAVTGAISPARRLSFSWCSLYLPSELPIALSCFQGIFNFDKLSMIE